MKHIWTECNIPNIQVDDGEYEEVAGWYCINCEKGTFWYEGLSSECSGYAGIERDMNKVLNDKKFYFRHWFDNLFPSSGFAGYSPFYAFTHPHKIVQFCFYEIKYAWQRVFRGWDDRVIWSIDIYLTENIPVWLEKLKSNKQGCPVEFFDDPYDTNSTDEDVSKAKEKWENEIQIMIDGFLASKKIQDFQYNNDDEFKKLEDIFNNGMKAFTKYYFNLWD